MEVEEDLSRKKGRDSVSSLCIESQQTLQKRLKKLKLQEEESMRKKIKETKEMSNGVETKAGITQSDFVSLVSDMTHVHPGLQVFSPVHFGMYYNTEFLLTENNIFMITPAYLQRLIIREALKTPESLFRLMAVVTDSVTAESCWERLSSVYPNWTVPFAEIVLVFLNWGASVEVLSVPAEIFEVIVNLDNLCEERRSHLGKPYDYNIRFVLYYILHTFKLLKPADIVIMFRILVLSAMDSNFHSSIFHLKRTLGALLDAVSESVWINIVNDLIISINLNDLGTQNTVFVCSALLPQSPRGHQVALQLSYRLLQRLLNVECEANDCNEVTVRSVLNLIDSAVSIHEEPHQKLYQILTLVDSMVARIGNEINVGDLKELCTVFSNLKSQLDDMWMYKLDINYSLLRELIARIVSLWGMQITSLLEHSLHLGPQYTNY